MSDVIHKLHWTTTRRGHHYDLQPNRPCTGLESEAIEYWLRSHSINHTSSLRSEFQDVIGTLTLDCVGDVTMFLLTWQGRTMREVMSAAELSEIMNRWVTYLWDRAL